MNRLRIIRALHASSLNFSLSDAISIADIIHAEFDKPVPVVIPEPDLTTFTGRVEFAKACFLVMDHINNDRKIHAIKELRTIFATQAYDYSSLRQVKDVVDKIVQDLRHFSN